MSHYLFVFTVRALTFYEITYRQLLRLHDNWGRSRAHMRMLELCDHCRLLLCHPCLAKSLSRAFKTVISPYNHFTVRLLRRNEPDAIGKAMNLSRFRLYSTSFDSALLSRPIHGHEDPLRFRNRSPIPLLPLSTGVNKQCSLPRLSCDLTLLTT